ncbi:DNA double-strand break repair nuclease NurA [Halobacteriales archaeon Cl-PHB]
MTLDPVHVDGIARLAGRVGQRVDATDRGEVAETAWQDFLDPLLVDDEVRLEPLDEQTRQKVDVADAALQERPFPTQHGLDAGTINPTTFKNGLVLDVSQAAMAAVPSDVDLHRGRTIVMTVHTNDDTLDLHDDWRMDDEGYARRRILHAPRVDRYEQVVVHALALYLAESEHALKQADVVSDLLVLDGPIYPTGLLKWRQRDPELQRLLSEADVPRAVIESYLELVETFVDRGVPLVGFVKNSASKAVTRPLREKIGAPWVNDDAFFRRVLERRDDAGELQTDSLTFTNWFRSRLGTDSLVADPDALELGHDRSLASGAYDVTFFVIYDPRDDLVYRVEAPYAVTRDADTRRRLTDQLLAEVASERGPPRAVGKADALASIDRQGKQTLRDRIEREFETRQQSSYDDKRWGVLDDAV